MSKLFCSEKISLFVTFLDCDEIYFIVIFGFGERAIDIECKIMGKDDDYLVRVYYKGWKIGMVN
jgi:hypothetical protein